MKIRYLDNSGFALEEGGVLLVFDCWKFPEHGQGRLGEGFLCREQVQQYEKAYVFVSHSHADHFNPKIFDWAGAGVTYLLDGEISAPQGVLAQKLACGQVFADETLRVTAHPSTDIGISFQVEAFGKTIFHAGDLNCWHWAGENTPAEEAEARQAFSQALAEIVPKMPRADLAFFPVDPRLGTLLDDGALEFLHKVPCGLLVPMHFGQEFAAPRRFAQKMQGKARVWAPQFAGDVLEISC
jgi:L-ascorbate metabolism protein UlaG (beta-lactamase superfamily)